MARTAELKRKTNETDIAVKLNLDGSGEGTIDTGIPFFDHMLHQLAKHSLMDLTITAVGDTQIDGHHTVEDVGIVLGSTLNNACGDKRGMTRYGSASIPMNEALAEVSVDVSGRPFCVFSAPLPKGKVGDFDVELVEEFLRAFCNSGGLTLHVSVRSGTNLHHIIEAIFKALARSLGQALAIDGQRSGHIPSTKGAL